MKKKLVVLIFLISFIFLFFPQITISDINIFKSTNRSVSAINEPIFGIIVDLFRLTMTFEQERGPLIYNNTIVWLDSDGFHAYDVKNQTESIIF